MSSQLEVPGEFPGKYAPFQKITQLFFNASAKKSAEKSQWKLGFWIMVAVAVVLAMTINNLLPLKTVKIYRLEVDKAGAQSIVPMSTAEYTPSDNEVRARIKEMTVRMLTIDPRLMKKNLTKVELMMSGQARKQFQEFLVAEKPFSRIVEHSDLMREVQVSGVSKISDKVLLVDFITKERIGISDPLVKRRTMTLSYEIKPAQTDEEVLGDNPAGIYIVSFTLSELN